MPVFVIAGTLKAVAHFSAGSLPVQKLKPRPLPSHRSKIHITSNSSNKVPLFWAMIWRRCCQVS
jgi:hypothetical protein